jgi:hypothetical protein
MFMNVFRKKAIPASDSLKSYFIKLYFNNPWTSADCPSFVYCDASDSVRGFVGAIPVPMKVGDRRIIASVAGNHMIDPGLKDPFAGVLLLRKLFASNPVLTISDSANEISKTLWTGLGANVLTLNSMRWVRILQPCRYFLSLISHQSSLGRLKPLLRPICAAADLIASGFFRPPGRSSSQVHAAKAFDVKKALTAFPEIIGRRTILPDYTEDGLTQLLAMASEKEQFGPLFNRVVEDSSGNVAGWYMYYASRGDVAQVLQFAARSHMTGTVLGHLFNDARTRGCIAVMGGIETASVKEFSENQCLFFLRNMYSVAYSLDKEIMDALLKGDTFISRLEGEFWTRLQGDQF